MAKKIPQAPVKAYNRMVDQAKSHGWHIHEESPSGRITMRHFKHDDHELQLDGEHYRVHSRGITKALGKGHVELHHQLSFMNEHGTKAFAEGNSMLDLDSVLSSYDYTHQGRGTWTHPKGHKVTVGENGKSWLHSADTQAKLPMKNGFGAHTLKEHLEKVFGKVSQHEESEQFAEYDEHAIAKAAKGASEHAKQYRQKVYLTHDPEFNTYHQVRHNMYSKDSGTILSTYHPNGTVEHHYKTGQHRRLFQHGSQHQESIASPPPLRAVADSLSAPIQFAEGEGTLRDFHRAHPASTHHQGKYYDKYAGHHTLTAFHDLVAKHGGTSFNDEHFVIPKDKVRDFHAAALRKGYDRRHYHMA